jgi:serralysin
LIAGTGDFNGDGQGDILWRGQNGDVGMWLMSGILAVTTANLRNVDLFWRIQP